MQEIVVLEGNSAQQVAHLQHERTVGDVISFSIKIEQTALAGASEHSPQVVVGIIVQRNETERTLTVFLACEKLDNAINATVLRAPSEFRYSAA
jgi:hypothetical protein